MLDTLAIAQKLRGAGFSDVQAEALASAVQQAAGIPDTSDLATKTDLTGTMAALKSDIALLKAEMKADIAELKADLQSWIIKSRVRSGYPECHRRGWDNGRVGETAGTLTHNRAAATSRPAGAIADRCPLRPHKRRKSGHFLTAASVESRMGAVAWAMRQRSVSHPRSSNRTCGFPASGSPTGFTVRPTKQITDRKRRLRGVLSSFASRQSFL